jgi:hypothetical protein
MDFLKIEVDEDIWQFLKRNAEPLEDTPNSVLRRLLLGKNDKPIKHHAIEHNAYDYPKFPSGTPQALSQVLEVIHAVHKFGISRSKATNVIAKRRNTSPQTIIDKYCRQLGKRAYEIDRLLHTDNMLDFQSLLENKFPRHNNIIIDFFKSLKK